MPKKGYEQLSTTLPSKFMKILRTQAFKERVNMSEILERYQQAYLEKLEREKKEKQEKRES